VWIPLCCASIHLGKVVFKPIVVPSTILKHQLIQNGSSVGSNLSQLFGGRVEFGETERPRQLRALGRISSHLTPHPKKSRGSGRILSLPPALSQWGADRGGRIILLTHSHAGGMVKVCCWWQGRSRIGTDASRGVAVVSL